MIGAPGRRSVDGPWSRIGVAVGPAWMRDERPTGRRRVVGCRTARQPVTRSQRTTVPRQLADLACPPAHIYVCLCLWSDDAPPRPRGETRGCTEQRSHTHSRRTPRPPAVTSRSPSPPHCENRGRAPGMFRTADGRCPGRV